MSELPSGYGAPPEVVPANRGRATLRSAPGGIRTPFAVALVGLLLLAAADLLVFGRLGADEAPEPVLSSRAAIVHATAQSLRKGIDEATDDLVVLGVTLADRPREEWGGLVAGFRSSHPRYLNVYVVGPDRQPRDLDGEARPLVDLLPDPLPGAPGLTQVEDVGTRPGLLAYAPVPGAPGELLVGRYDTAFLRVALAQLAPGRAYVLDAEDRIVASTRGFLALQRLEEPQLVEAAAVVRGEEPVTATQADGSLVAASPVRGPSSAGRLGLSVVSQVDVRQLSLPANDARRLGLLLGGITALLTVLSFAWFYLAVVRPVRRLAGDAERIALGDRSTPLNVTRYDEIGLVERAVERCRVLLLDADRRR